MWVILYISIICCFWFNSTSLDIIIVDLLVMAVLSELKLKNTILLLQYHIDFFLSVFQVLLYFYIRQLLLVLTFKYIHFIFLIWLHIFIISFLQKIVVIVYDNNVWCLFYACIFWNTWIFQWNWVYFASLLSFKILIWIIFDTITSLASTE